MSHNPELDLAIQFIETLELKITSAQKLISLNAYQDNLLSTDPNQSHHFGKPYAPCQKQKQNGSQQSINQDDQKTKIFH